ncbi:MAG: RNA polymerase sigma factor RpoD/SigA [Candidatus Latescibacteria bacterium]|jgi:RNA polymerase primary sigma factor|nr:RNA polymerase sigma factor RpoD/SigA [Candidatus Latescibacterota bacterium]
MFVDTRERQRMGDEPSLAYYYKEVERHPQLTTEEERALTKRITQGDENAREGLVKANLRFVIHVAKQFQNQGLSIADLINEGNMGLITAAQKFKPEKGYKFITYAVWWIRQNILKALEVQTRSIRIPANVINDLNKLRRVEAGLSQTLERAPDVEELSLESGISTKKVHYTLDAIHNTVSLDSPVYDDNANTNLQETLPDTEHLHPEDAYIQHTMHQDVRTALNNLPDRDRKILHLYFGFHDEERATYQQIGTYLGVSRERVRQLKEDALTRLRHPATRRKLATYCS